MQTLKLTLEPKSSFITPLQSDTLFGQFCWTWRDLYGEQSLEKLLQNFDNQPAVVFSNAFPVGHLPCPILPPPTHRQMETIIQQTLDCYSDKVQEQGQEIAATAFKKMRKREWLHWETLEPIQSSLTAESLVDSYFQDILLVKGESISAVKEQSIVTKTIPVFKNSLNRYTHRTTKGAQSLYHFDETFFGATGTDDSSSPVPPQLDIYIALDPAKIDSKQATEVMGIIGMAGYGKDKSTGKGRFTITHAQSNPEELQYHHDEAPNAYVALGNSVGGEVIAARTHTKYPKHGGLLAANGQHIKNPIVLYTPGSIFACKERHSFYGKALQLDPERPNHWHNAYTLPLFVRMEDAHA